MSKLAFALVVALVLPACGERSPGQKQDFGDSSLPDSQPAPRLTLDAAEATSEPIHSPAAGNSRLAVYQGSTYGQIAVAARVASAGLDGEIALSYADDLCNLDLNAVRAEPASINDLRSFQNRFCTDYHASGETIKRFSSIDRAAQLGDPEAELLQLAESLTEEVPSDQLQAVADDLNAAARATDSPYVFQTAYEMLYSEPLYDVSLDQDRPPGMNDESLLAARGFGSLLATCERFKHCGPNSLMAKRFCMPTECAPGQDVRAYVQRKLPLDAYREAERSSRMLLADMPPLPTR